MQLRSTLGIGAVMLSALVSGACGRPEGVPVEAPRLAAEVDTVAAPLTLAASYDPVMRIPRCMEVASGCDTVDLVNGRGSVGPERNAPNTLGGSCADDIHGEYTRDESIERVKVYTADGTPLAPGKQVTIEVDVWAWSGYTSDALDLYFLADTRKPAWRYLTTLFPSGPGAQSLKANHLLPSGGSVQAVRAAFRYGGSAGVCAPGTYNDRDDLAFAVEPPAPMRLTKRFAAGFSFSLQLHPEGTVWAYGYNYSGQLGVGTTDYSRSSPVQTVGLNDVKSVAAGWSHALALKQDGTVWSWGRNSNGQLGDGTTTQRNAPVQVAGLTDVTAISTHYWHSLALKRDGTVWAWGENAEGELGNGTLTSSLVPVQVVGLSDVSDIAASGYHSVALKKDGTVWTWGWNGSTLR